MSTAQHVILFRYSWFHMGPDRAVVGPFASADEAQAALEPLAAEGLLEHCEAVVAPIGEMDPVLAALRAGKAKADAEAAAELARRGGQLTIDEIVARCEALSDLLPVTIASEAGDSPFEGQTVDGTDSYRGSYDELAIVPSQGPPVVLAHFRDEMRRSLGGCYCGHKGGEYYMSGDTHVWLSDHGVSSGLAVVDVRLSADGARVEVVCKLTG